MLISSANHLYFVSQENIIFCKSDNCYTSFFLANCKELVICRSLKKVIAELSPELFIKVSQSYVINKTFITIVDKKKKMITLADNHIAPFTITLRELLTSVFIEHSTP